MAIERTFSIIKPDAVSKNLIGKVISTLEAGGLRVIAARMVHLTQDQARRFYAVHAARPFYNDLVKFMTEGPIVVQVLEGENAVARNREIMGATNPAQADEGTIRKLYGESIERNACHGSDGPDTARQEIAFFFPECDLPSATR